MTDKQDERTQRLLTALEPHFEEMWIKFAKMVTNEIILTEFPKLADADEKTQELAVAAMAADMAGVFADAARRKAVKIAGTELAVRDFAERIEQYA